MDASVGVGFRGVIPQPADQIGHRLRRGRSGGSPPGFDAETYKERNVELERCIARLKQWRGLAMRTDRLAIAYQAALHLAAILIWTRRLTRRSNDSSDQPMDDGSILFSVKGADQDVGLPPVPTEETSLVDVDDQNVVAVDHLGDALGLDRVRPRVQVPTKPLRQPARLGNSIPEVVECLDRPTAQINDQLAIRHRSRLTSPHHGVLTG